MTHTESQKMSADKLAILDSIAIKLTIISALLINLFIQGCQQHSTQKEILKELRQQVSQKP